MNGCFNRRMIYFYGPFSIALNLFHPHCNLHHPYKDSAGVPRRVVDSKASLAGSGAKSIIEEYHGLSLEISSWDYGGAMAFDRMLWWFNGI